MPRKAHSEEQILAVLHEGESGTKVAEICRRPGISQATYFVWKKYAGLGVSELRELRQLREEVWQTILPINTAISKHNNHCSRCWRRVSVPWGQTIPIRYSLATILRLS